MSLYTTLILALAIALVPTAEPPQSTPASSTGVLLLAHGGRPEWNDNVSALAEQVDREHPTEVAFGMATRANIQAGVDALVRRGVTDIVAVPLFVSSHSSIVTSTEYLLGLRDQPPADLAVFAAMAHGPGGHAGHAGHKRSAEEIEAAKRPVQCPVPIRMSGALDSHPVVASILADRARTVSRDPSREAVILVAHGPVSDEENRKWLAELRALATRVKTSVPFAAIDYLTVRDDAPPPIRRKATVELRSLVERHRQSGRRVVIVPVLLSFGGIEVGIRERLEGLDVSMTSQAIMPDDRLADWVLDQAKPR